MTRRRFVALCLGGLSVGLLGGCQNGPSAGPTGVPVGTAGSPSPAVPSSVAASPSQIVSRSPAPSASPAAQAPAVLGAPVTVSYGNVSQGPTELGMHFAEQQGFLDHYGVTLSHVVLETSTSTAAALVGRSVDVTSVSPPSLIVAYVKGTTDLALIATAQEKATYTLISAPDIASYDALRGKTVGISSPGDGLTVLTKQLLAKHGLDEADYAIVSVGASNQRFAALQSYQVQAVCITQPFDFQLEHLGFNRLGDVSEVAPNFSFGGLGSRRSWVSDNQDTATRFLAGALRGQQFLNDPANREAVSQEMQSYLQMSAEDAAATYDLLITQLKVFPSDLTPSSDGLQAVIDVSVALGDVDPPGPTQAELLDLDALHAAQSLVASGA